MMMMNTCGNWGGEDAVQQVVATGCRNWSQRRLHRVLSAGLYSIIADRASGPCRTIGPRCRFRSLLTLSRPTDKRDDNVFLWAGLHNNFSFDLVIITQVAKTGWTVTLWRLTRYLAYWTIVLLRFRAFSTHVDTGFWAAAKADKLILTRMQIGLASSAKHYSGCPFGRVYSAAANTGIAPPLSATWPQVHFKPLKIYRPVIVCHNRLSWPSSCQSEIMIFLTDNTEYKLCGTNQQ